MIKKKDNAYKLDTPNTTLVIGTGNGSAEYLYYGKKLPNLPCDYHVFGGVGYTADSVEKECKLLSSFGETDMQRCGVTCRFADGSFTTRFSFLRAKITDKPDLSPLPSSRVKEDEKTSKTLCLEFIDEPSKLKLFLYYTVFEDCDVIAVSSRLYNGGKKEVSVLNLPSLQLDLYGRDYDFVTFRGGWASERNKRVMPVNGGAVLVNESRIGSSSHTANPFVMLKKRGSVYAFNLIYSGNHKESAESDFLPRTRVLVGINDFMFDKKLAPGEDFYSPEAVMCFGETEDETSLAMHTFVKERIIRPKWKNKERPILINNWEATYFNFNRDKILSIADAAAELGIELFVLDDGWFGHRDADNSSLGDWVDYKEKTGGIAALAEAVRERGLKFGIWVEPEMISEDSELYKKHPEYTMKVPGREPLAMRRQFMLNLADTNVQKYLIRSISAVITETKAAYVKWDYNRRMSDCFTKDGEQSAYFHEYIKGVYTVMGKLIERFPTVLFEGCCGGGGRFDLGMLYFMPQFWTSDNTDARCRMRIQSGTSYAYPHGTISCHVSASPNHQTQHAAALETRFNVAMNGVFGYEMDLAKATENEKETIKKQVAFYKKYRKVLQFGTTYRLGDAFEDAVSGFISVNESKTLAIANVTVDFTEFGYSNFKIRFKGLDEHTVYEVSCRQQDNHETEKPFIASGALLMNGDIPLHRIGDDKSAERNANSLHSRCFIIKKAPTKKR